MAKGRMRDCEEEVFRFVWFFWFCFVVWVGAISYMTLGRYLLKVFFFSFLYCLMLAGSVCVCL